MSLSLSSEGKPPMGSSLGIAFGGVAELVALAVAIWFLVKKGEETSEGECDGYLYFVGTGSCLAGGGGHTYTTVTPFVCETYGASRDGVATGSGAGARVNTSHPPESQQYSNQDMPTS
ncbi:hypothetical protein PM082_008938 [Marasmius tenuissimus]|nr:hypothetical protein PM082_008938 [Marasmius tenuissimus]